jgi:hypothetical protein
LALIGQDDLHLSVPAGSGPMMLYSHEVDHGLANTDAWDGMIGPLGPPWGHRTPGTPANDDTSGHPESAEQREIGDQSRTASTPAADS